MLSPYQRQQITPSVEKHNAKKIILDVDTGGDDAVAILLAGHHPELQLEAVTVTHGNAPLLTTLDNTLRVIEAGKLSHIPVFSGADRPIVADPIPTKPVQRSTLPLPSPTSTPQPQRAAEFLIDYYLSPQGPSTCYVPLGPQTNLALALRLEPKIAERIPSITTMAGAYIEGNTTPSAEFNVLADPEAAHIVFTAGIPITMVGLEVTVQALLSLDDAEELGKRGTIWAEIASRIIKDEVLWFMNNLGWDGGQIYDACAVAALVDPLILETQPMHVAIELFGQHSRGRTVADISGYHKNPPNVNVGGRIDRDRFMEILFEGLS
jgi:inosine-uridine nucleoside N-ribohydrolase